MPFTHLPMFLAMVIFGFYQSEASLVFVMILLGCCLGTTANCRNALTAELFGPKFLATLKSITSTLVVISSAIAPIAFAWINKYGHFNYSVYLMMSLSLLTIPAYYLGIHLYKKQ
jgi:MFS family permease